MNLSVKNRKTQNKKESSVSGRKKCMPASRDEKSCDSGKSPGPKETRGVHNINTPWLVAKKDIDGNTKRKQVKKHLRSVLCYQKRRPYAEEDNIVGFPSKPDPSIQLPHYIFPTVAPTDFTSLNTKRIDHGSTNDPSGNDKIMVESLESSVNHQTMNIKQSGKNMKNDESTQPEIHNNDSSTLAPSDETHSSRETFSEKLYPEHQHRKYRTEGNEEYEIRGKDETHFGSETPSNKLYSEHQHRKYRTEGNEVHSMKFEGSKITTPRRRNTRSPSPARLREQAESQSRRFESQRHESADYDREMLMGLEMQRDLDRMSLKCGTTEGDLRSSSNSGIKSNPNGGNSTPFSILPSSVSCFNPTTQVDAFETKKGNVHRVNLHDENNRVWVDTNAPTSNRSKPMKKGVCSGVSSALLCDIKDDDAFWEYYDDRKPVRRSSIHERKGAEIEARESRDSRHSLTDQRQRSNSIDREPRISYDGNRLDQFGHPIPNGIVKNVAFTDMAPFENTRSQTRYSLEHNPPSNTFETDHRYESLMNYPTKSRYDQEELQPSKEELLDQMRHAVQKASAQLKKARTMETEYSDESSYASSLPKQQRNQSFPSDLERKSAISLGMRRDKYEFI